MIEILSQAASVALGGACGAVARWCVTSALNLSGASVQIGTLAVNIAGGAIIGIASRAFAAMPGVAPELRLAVITGFLGALTTFSTFSLEAASLLKCERYGAFAASVALHLGGSLCATLVGIALCDRALKIWINF